MNAADINLFTFNNNDVHLKTTVVEHHHVRFCAVVATWVCMSQQSNMHFHIWLCKFRIRVIQFI